MNFLKNILTLIGAIVVFGLLFAFVKFDLGARIGQVSKLDSQALPEYMKMFDRVLTTGDPTKGIVRKVKMVIPEGMTKAQAFENALKIMDKVASEYGLDMVDQKTMPRDGKLFKDGGRLTHIRAYCSAAIADVYLGYSAESIAFMPCRIGFVEEENGDIWLYTMGMELMINGGRTLPPKLLTLAKEIRTALYTMTVKAAAGEDL